MATTKHARGDDDVGRPSKKAKVDNVTDELTEKAKSKLEKRKRKEEKAKRKEEKKRRKENETLEDENVASNEPLVADAQVDSSKPAKDKKVKKDKKDKKGKKDGKSTEPSESPTGSGKYSETISLASLPQSEIDEFLSNKEIFITDPLSSASGSTLRPVIAFEHLPSTNLLEKKPSPFANYKAPTPIQAASWPYTLSGRDAVGVAETGSGKTMAFALPCVESVMEAKRSGVKAVVVSPTRELAMQTHVQLAQLAALVNLKCVCLYGGSSKDDQRALLRKGADIIVATPGRLKDFMSDATVELGSVCFAVLDEADRMLDKGFEDDIKEILGSCLPREKRQTLMFTATWPDSVQNLASSFMVDPVKITIGSAGKDSHGGAVELQANARITQQVEVLEPQDKEFRLLQILKQQTKSDRVLVFCLYKKEATRIENFLGRKGIRVAGIHGDLRQEQRTRSLEAFKSGQTPVLVATDVAARGLDIPEVKLVINVTFPLTIEDYVHRIGRTGRAGNTGNAHTFFTTQDKAHSGSLINILRGANQPVPDDLLKFGSTVKKKTHAIYGDFFKDVDMTATSTKITFD